MRLRLVVRRVQAMTIKTRTIRKLSLLLLTAFFMPPVAAQSNQLWKFDTGG